jgi:hypothetical protein
VKRLLAAFAIAFATLPTATALAGDGAGLSLVAPQTVAAEAVRYETTVSGDAPRVAFFVDGVRRWTDRAVGGLRREGRLSTSGLGDGAHSLSMTVRRRGGRVLRTRRVIFVSARTRGRKRKEEPAPAPTPAPEEPAPAPEEPVPAPEEPAPVPAPEEPVPTPVPAPEEPAPAPTGSLLFNGAKLSSFAQIQAAPGAIGEVADPLGGAETDFSFTVKDSDVYPLTPTSDPRAQALSPSFIDPGEEIWLKTKVMFPANFPKVSGWMSLASIYGPPFNGSSPWSIGTSNDQLRWQRNGTYRYDVPWSMPLVRGRWITILLHERFASDGWVEMWVDGQRVTFFGSGTYNPGNVAPTDRLSMATRDASNNGGANHAKIMQYRQADLFDTATVYFGALQVGTTRSAVGG